MKKPKFFTFVAAFAVILSGCATTSKTQRWATIAKIAARRGTVETVKSHPEYRIYFATAAEGIDALLLTNSISYDALLSELRKLPIKELKGDEGALLFRDAVDLYDAALGDVLRLKDGSGLRVIAQSLVAGIREGLVLAGPPSPGATSPQSEISDRFGFVPGQGGNLLSLERLITFQETSGHNIFFEPVAAFHLPPALDGRAFHALPARFTFPSNTGAGSESDGREYAPSGDLERGLAFEPSRFALSGSSLRPAPLEFHFRPSPDMANGAGKPRRKQ